MKVLLPMCNQSDISRRSSKRHGIIPVSVVLGVVIWVVVVVEIVAKGVVLLLVVAISNVISNSNLW